MQLRRIDSWATRGQGKQGDLYHNRGPFDNVRFARRHWVVAAGKEGIMASRVKVGIGAAATAACALGAVLGAGPAQAAPSTQQISCGDQTLTIRVNNNHSSDNGGWSAAQIMAGGTGHLIPTSFTFSAYDVTTRTTLFSQTQPKGGGNGNQNQATISCSQTQTGVLADLLSPGDAIPPGATLTDIVTTSFTVTAVHKP